VELILGLQVEEPPPVALRGPSFLRGGLPRELLHVRRGWHLKRLDEAKELLLVLQAGHAVLGVVLHQEGAEHLRLNALELVRVVLQPGIDQPRVHHRGVSYPQSLTRVHPVQTTTKAAHLSLPPSFAFRGQNVARRDENGQNNPHAPRL